MSMVPVVVGLGSVLSLAAIAIQVVLSGRERRRLLRRRYHAVCGDQPRV